MSIIGSYLFNLIDIAIKQFDFIAENPISSIALVAFGALALTQLGSSTEGVLLKEKPSPKQIVNEVEDDYESITERGTSEIVGWIHSVIKSLGIKPFEFDLKIVTEMTEPKVGKAKFGSGYEFEIPSIFLLKAHETTEICKGPGIYSQALNKLTKNPTDWEKMKKFCIFHEIGHIVNEDLEDYPHTCSWIEKERRADLFAAEHSGCAKEAAEMFRIFDKYDLFVSEEHPPHQERAQLLESIGKDESKDASLAHR
jgi:hypothetical protein